jgi:hypothetical protein
VFSEGPEMHLSPYGTRSKKFFQNFGFAQKTPARFCPTTVSNKCLKQVFYPTRAIGINVQKKKTPPLAFSEGDGVKYLQEPVSILRYLYNP